MAPPVALSISHDPAGTCAPAAAADALARPGGVRVSLGGARLAGDGADVGRLALPTAVFSQRLYGIRQSRQVEDGGDRTLVVGRDLEHETVRRHELLHELDAVARIERRRPVGRHAPGLGAGCAAADAERYSVLIPHIAVP